MTSLKPPLDFIVALILKTFLTKNMNYTVNTTPAKKHTITISRKALWNNYMDSMKDIIWDNYADFKDMEEVKQAATILCCGKLTYTVRELFKRGDSFLLLGDAMKYVENDDALVEIVVTDGDEQVIVSHFDINY